jgi:A/G-specific adenine glycosylase
MLQQTRVSTVIPYFERFLETYPSLTDLANAEEDQVLDIWSGLGYYGRARNLHRAARIIRDKYESVFPSRYKQVIGLPGIGPYSAAAVLSIAFGQQYAVLDGNVRRFLARYLALREEVKGPLLKNLESLLSEIASSEHLKDSIADFNQSLMELGALVCTPRDPRCSECPLAKSCLAVSKGLQSELPKAKKSRKLQEVSFTSAVIDREGRYLMCRNSEETYLRGFWEFPKVAGGPIEEDLTSLFRNLVGLELSVEQRFEPVIHHITFRRITLYPVRAVLLTDLSDPDFHWVKFGEKPYPTSSYVQKILKRITGS